MGAEGVVGFLIIVGFIGLLAWAGHDTHVGHLQKQRVACAQQGREAFEYADGGIACLTPAEIAAAKGDK